MAETDARAAARRAAAGDGDLRAMLAARRRIEQDAQARNAAAMKGHPLAASVAEAISRAWCEIGMTEYGIGSPVRDAAVAAVLSILDDAAILKGSEEPGSEG